MGTDHRGLQGRSRWMHGWSPVAFVMSLVVLATFLIGCSPSSGTEVGEEPRPTRLRVGWVPNDEDLERRVRFERLITYLSQRLDLPVELVQTGTYSTAIEAMRARKLDVCSMGPFAYLIAHEKAGVEALIAPGNPAGEVNSYRSVLVVPKDSPIHTIEDVRRHAKTMTLAWVDPASASGHLVPRAYLESVGFKPEEDFKNTIFTLSHLASAMAIKAGNIDLAVITQNTRQKLITTGRVAEEDLRVIWTSAPIAVSVTAVRGEFSDEFKQELVDAYLSFRTEDPEGWGQFQRMFVDPTTVWVAARDEDYDELRALARNVRHLNLID